MNCDRCKRTDAAWFEERLGEEVPELDVHVHRGVVASAP